MAISTLEFPPATLSPHHGPRIRTPTHPFYPFHQPDYESSHVSNSRPSWSDAPQLGGLHSVHRFVTTLSLQHYTVVRTIQREEQQHHRDTTRK